MNEGMLTDGYKLSGKYIILIIIIIINKKI